jgi:polyketide synthase Type III
VQSAEVPQQRQTGRAPEHISQEDVARRGNALPTAAIGMAAHPRDARPARLLAVGSANPKMAFTQRELADILRVPNGPQRRFFEGNGIQTRYLYFREATPNVIAQESQGDLLSRHRQGCLELGREAIAKCLGQCNVDTASVDFLCCVTSTGLMLPPLSAMYIRHLGFRTDCQRIDIVGMGCNAALNALNAAASWSVAHPGSNALVVCCEINSAVHVVDDRMVTCLVNSLFGDGCAAALLNTNAGGIVCPSLVAFSSCIVPDAWKAISYWWSDSHKRFELFLDKSIPSLLGRYSPVPISSLFAAFRLSTNDVAHWLIHAGGIKVIEAVAAANGLSKYDVRHSFGVLTRMGNVGSATIMFSYEDLVGEGVAKQGDRGVMVTMGPGATIEAALLEW